MYLQTIFFGSVTLGGNRIFFYTVPIGVSEILARASRIDVWVISLVLAIVVAEGVTDSTRVWREFVHLRAD